MQMKTQTALEGLASSMPLCVDLDGTIIAEDSLVISLRQILRRKPWHLPLLAAAALRGRAYFKKRVADCLVPQPQTLPYRAAVLDYLTSLKTAGRRLILATAAEQRIAHAVAAHLGIFDAVLACNGVTNLKGSNKLTAIRRLLNDAPFEYMGDSSSDLPILLAAHGAYLVNPSPHLLQAIQAKGNLRAVF